MKKRRSRVNKIYDIGEFDTLAQYKPITGFGTDIDSTVTYGAAVTVWIKYDYSFKSKFLDHQEKDNEITTIITRNHISGIKPNTHVFIIDGEQYRIKKVEQMGRRLHTKISLYQT